MSKITKVFWIDGESLEIIEKDLYENIVINRRKSTSKLHKITIAYEIDREITIKESDLRKALDDLEFSERDFYIIKQRIFGGGENE